ncbi:GAD-like domain-containing protein [Paenilisteria weihenstephanensis]|uniref:GAD-like domain-containing protein n=1 Tax=Listeria weihenstephanensis TaxID=1006155 RepID=UPI002D21911B|nr:GAD-like domain-containing protein [Listeria weihenstephanensis]
MLQDFQLIEKVPANVLQEYQDKVPEEVVQFWKEYGFGTFMEGYFKSVNPLEYKEILVSTSERYTDGIVLFTTGMGDLIIWSDGYVRMINYRYGIVKTIFFLLSSFSKTLRTRSLG